MVQGKVFRFLYVVVPISLVLSTLFLFAPSVFAATVRSATSTRSSLIGPKSIYLALGDSLASGFQPDGDNSHGYPTYFFNDLKNHGVQSYVNLACPGETTITMITGLCPGVLTGSSPASQLRAAVNFLRQHPGQVSPVTLDIGANDVTPFFNYSTCQANLTLARAFGVFVDHNFRDVILPQLRAAMTVNGEMTGDIFVMNYYDPFVHKCPNSLSFLQELNQHIAADISGQATLVDVFDAFGGTTVPNPNICTYTWICSKYFYLLGIHATDTGYQVIAHTFEQTAGY